MFNFLPAYISILCNTVYSALQFRTYQSIYQQHVLVVIRLFRSSGPSKNNKYIYIDPIRFFLGVWHQMVDRSINGL